MSRHLQPVAARGEQCNRVSAARRPLELFLRLHDSELLAPSTKGAMRDDSDAMGRRRGPGRPPAAPRAEQLVAAWSVRNRLAARQDDLNDLLAAIEDALTEPPRRDLAELQIGTAIDAIPHGQPPDVEGHLDTVVAVLIADGLGPQLVARVCDIIVRTRHSVPAPAAFLEAAVKARAELESGRGALRTYRDLLRRADELVALGAADREATASGDCLEH